MNLFIHLLSIVTIFVTPKYLSITLIETRLAQINILSEVLEETEGDI